MSVTLVKSPVSVADITVTIIEATYVAYHDGDETDWDLGDSQTYRFATTYAEYRADDWELSPAAWVASRIRAEYCDGEASDSSPNAHTWHSAETYAHPATDDRLEKSAHMSGADWTDDLAREVAELVKRRR